MKKDNTKRNKIIWTVIIVVLMSSSIFGYAMFGAEEQTTYNKFKFTKTQAGWQTKINKEIIQFYFHPSEVENLNLSSDIIDVIRDKSMIYLTFNPDEEELGFIDLARFDLANIFLNNLDIYTESATTKNSTPNFPIIDCSDATDSIPVLKLMLSNSTEFEKQDNCILLKARTGQDILALKDRLLYSLLGVME